jgi:hypothetical protein
MPKPTTSEESGVSLPCASDGPMFVEVFLGMRYQDG